MKIRKGTKKDIPAILDLIIELAEYEKAAHEVEVSVESMLIDGFSEKPVFEFLVAETNGVIAGLALYYFRYSTWKGKKLYLEDFVVSNEFRGKGTGKLLFDAILKKSLEENCNGISWQVLEWNDPAINFYKKYPAEFDGDWLNGSISKDEILKLSL